jgi:hypothetical protein
VIEVYRDNICNVDTEIDDLQSLIGEFLEAREKITEITSKARRLPLYREEIERINEGASRSKQNPIKASEM